MNNALNCKRTISPESISTNYYEIKIVYQAGIGLSINQVIFLGPSRGIKGINWTPAEQIPLL